MNTTVVAFLNRWGLPNERSCDQFGTTLSVKHILSTVNVIADVFELAFPHLNGMDAVQESGCRGSLVLGKSSSRYMFAT